MNLPRGALCRIQMLLRTQGLGIGQIFVDCIALIVDQRSRGHRIEEIVVDCDTAMIKKSYAALANAIAQKKKGTSNEVPCFVFDWRARSDSNARPSGS